MIYKCILWITAKAIFEFDVLEVPIIEVYINAYDIIRILRLAEGYRWKKIFLAYPSIVNSFKQLSEFMGYELESKSYFQHKEVKEIKKSGFLKDQSNIIFNFILDLCNLLTIYFHIYYIEDNISYGGKNAKNKKRHK